MLNYLWGFMILIGVVYGAFHGTLPDITNAALDSAKEAVSLCITMMGVMSFWVGLMKIAENTGIIKSAVKHLMPFPEFRKTIKRMNISQPILLPIFLGLAGQRHLRD